MLRHDFSFALPKQLIAQQPTDQRTASRLLVMQGAELQDAQFTDLPEFLKPGDLLVFNNTKVIPARLYGHKSSGGRVEILIERLLDQHCALAHVRASRSPKPDSQIHITDDLHLTVVKRHADLFELRCTSKQTLLDILHQHGHIPLPPYIERSDTDQDYDRYQTVYASQPGAVAAPTAGLHFDQDLINRLSAQGIAQAFITLHVGAGTFQPVRVENIAEHQMHSELVSVDAAVCETITATQSSGGRVIAVGTTVARSLEAACLQGHLQPLHGETDIFIYPGYQFRCIDALITNFHLPESTLLMLVAAFAGHKQTMQAYQHAIAHSYRFFSYGDAMFIQPDK